MHWRSWATWAITTLALTSERAQAADSTIYRDSVTGFTFAQHQAPYANGGHYVTFRIAVPDGVSAGQAYDVVLQMVAPNDVGWAAMAWNGAMTKNPLTVMWKYGQTAIVSSRWADTRTLPSAYSGASYEILKKGTFANGTHFQFTARCSGCTTFGSKTLSATTIHHMAMAYSPQGPSNPASNTSSFPAHTVNNYWDHDFGQGVNPTFNQLVVRNGGTAPTMLDAGIEEAWGVEESTKRSWKA